MGIEYRLVFVEWVDSYGCSSSWGMIPEKDPIAHSCFSIGWLVRESGTALVIVPHISPKNEEINSDENGCGDMTIPRCSILSIKEISLG